MSHLIIFKACEELSSLVDPEELVWIDTEEPLTEDEILTWVDYLNEVE